MTGVHTQTARTHAITHAIAVRLAHLRGQETRGDHAAYHAASLAALCPLYDLGYNHAEILRPYRVID